MLTATRDQRLYFMAAVNDVISAPAPCWSSRSALGGAGAALALARQPARCHLALRRSTRESATLAHRIVTASAACSRAGLFIWLSTRASPRDLRCSADALNGIITPRSPRRASRLAPCGKA
jgi:hypothetical protein